MFINIPGTYVTKEDGNLGNKDQTRRIKSIYIKESRLETEKQYSDEELLVFNPDLSVGPDFNVDLNDSDIELDLN